MWTKDQLRIEYVQNTFFIHVSLILKIDRPRHDSLLCTTLSIPILSSCHSYTDLHFITPILNGSLDAPNLLSSVNFCVSDYFSKNHSLFYVPFHSTSYDCNYPMYYDDFATSSQLILIFKQSSVAQLGC